MRGFGPTAAVLALVLIALPGCSIKRMAAKSVANSLTTGPDVFGTDDDPELIRDALPFGLKTLESLHTIIPDHPPLLLALCRGFTQYAYGFVQLDAETIESTDYPRASEIKLRAQRLYLRGRDYGLRALERNYRGLGEQLRARPAFGAARLQKRDLPMLYWVAAAWGSAINLGKDRPELMADLEAVRALLARGITLDESYDRGALHEAFIVLEALPAAMGGSVERARVHFDRAIALSEGRRASPYVTMAQAVSVSTQNRGEFDELLHKALEVDPNQEPSQRLATILLQRKARMLLERTDELFLEEGPEK